MYNIELIKEEIIKNGNTNLITDSGLTSGQQIFAIGDSHTIFFYNSLKIKEHWFFGGNLPLTIYRLLNEELDIYNIGNILGNQHEKYNIKRNDYVIFYFGYNDIQKNIYIYSKNTWKQDINELCTNYIKKIIELQDKYKIHPIIPSIYPNPLPEAKGLNSNGYNEERTKYVLFANNLLNKLCKDYKIDFLDIYHIITDEKGFIKTELSKDKIHLDYDNNNLRIIIENKILEICSYPS
jgi:lysophospholipase L1-like esterase